MGTPFAGLSRSLSLVSKAGGNLGAALIVVTAILITMNCFARYVFNRPMMFVDEYSCYMLVALVYIGLGATLRAGKHVYVDMLVGKLSIRLQRGLGIATLCLGILPAVVMCWYSWRSFWSTYTGKIVSLTPLQTPLWIPYLAVAIGLTIFVVDLIVVAAERVATAGHTSNS